MKIQENMTLRRLRTPVAQQIDSVMQRSLAFDFIGVHRPLVVNCSHPTWSNLL